jgi:hypothetical protein
MQARMPSKKPQHALRDPGMHYLGAALDRLLLGR